MNKQTEEKLCKCGVNSFGWVHDPDLCIWEKRFHWMVFWIGWGVLVFATVSLGIIVHKVLMSPIGQGAGTAVVSILMFLLVVFGVSCISGRGMAFIDEMLKFTKKATLFKIPGMEVSREKGE